MRGRFEDRAQLVVGRHRHRAGDVAVGIRMHALCALERGRVVDDRRERLDVELDQLERILGECPSLGDDERVRIADVAHFVVGQHLVRAGWPHRQHGGRTHRADEHVVQVDCGQHGNDTVGLACGSDVDAHDASARDVAPCERHVQHAGHDDVVDVATLPGQQSRILLAADAVADQTCGRCEDAHRSAALTTGAPGRLDCCLERVGACVVVVRTECDDQLVHLRLRDVTRAERRAHVRQDRHRRFVDTDARHGEEPAVASAETGVAATRDRTRS